VYKSLQSQGLQVRALVRNATKARAVLGCDKCDESDGVFEGDVTQADTLTAAMTGADSLVITTGPAYHCTFPSLYIGCKYYQGAEPEIMSWKSVRTQVSSFAASKGLPLAERHVVLLSNTMTTLPDNYLDKIDGGHGCFYALNGEAFVMNSGVPFTVVKPNGLDDAEPATKTLLVGHDDEEGWKNPAESFVSRGDVARVLTYVAANWELTTGLRFDLTSRKGEATTDLGGLLDNVRYPWDKRGKAVLV
jgi:hypothetical protein